MPRRTGKLPGNRQGPLLRNHLGFEKHRRIIYPTLRESPQVSQFRLRADGKPGRSGAIGAVFLKEMLSMIRHLTTLVLTGLLGSIVMVGNAEACHRAKCRCAAPVACVAPRPAPCVQTVTYCKPAPCVRPVVTKCCAPRVKLCSFHLPKLFCHKKCAPPPTLACVTPVCYAAAATVGYPAASPQTSAQH
jgi:hypothetical protein